MDDKIKQILQSICIIDVDTTIKDIQAQLEISGKIKEINAKYDGLNYYVKVQDTTKLHWKPKDHFTKIFNYEIEHAKELYDLTKSEVLFLYSLSPYLMWELNLIVDEENNPLNQKLLSEKLKVDRKTIQRYMKSLELKKCIISIPVGKDTFYLVNPNIMYCGRNINMVLPALFSEIGYQSTYNIRSNREKVNERSKINTFKD
jgi:hypothetical protein